MSGKYMNKISDAISAYKECDDTGRSSYRSLLRDVIDSGSAMVVNNHSYADALELTSEMMARANKSFCMFIGGGVENFLEVLKTPFSEMLQRLKMYNGQARIIVLGVDDAPFLEEIKKENSESFDFKTAHLKPGLEKIKMHFTVADTFMCRVEEPHDPITEESPADSIRAKVYFNDSEKAESYNREFDVYWNSLSKREAEKMKP